MRDWTQRVHAGEIFAPADIPRLAGELLSADATDEEKADFLEAFHARGERPDEIAALASAFLAKAEAFDLPAGLPPFIDVCGTGGDKLGLFNVSTAVMFVVAGAGIPVVKHGNRGVTSRSGGADVLEALGIAVELPAAKHHAMLEEAKATFLFAPLFHPAFKSIAPARKILGARGKASVFNMLGPLLNPARPPHQMAGVFAERLVPLYAEILPQLGRRTAWVVHGKTPDGVMDEISTLGPTTIAMVSEDGCERSLFQAEEFFASPGNVAELQGGDATENAAKLLGILGGTIRGAAKDIVVLNAAGALQAAGASTGWEEAIARAGESIDSGAAMAVLSTMRRLSA